MCVCLYVGLIVCVLVCKSDSVCACLYLYVGLIVCVFVCRADNVCVFM